MSGDSSQDVAMEEATNLPPSPVIVQTTEQGQSRVLSSSSSASTTSVHRLDKRPTNVFSAVYSNVPVWEAECGSPTIGVMRRQKDNWMNCTQILKVAGLDKANRTRILDTEITRGKHEKIQGGYGKFQGTWVPFERAMELAKDYGVYEQLKEIFDFDPITDEVAKTPSKDKKARSQRSGSAVASSDILRVPRTRTARKPKSRRARSRTGGSSSSDYSRSPSASPPTSRGRRPRQQEMPVLFDANQNVDTEMYESDDYEIPGYMATAATNAEGYADLPPRPRTSSPLYDAALTAADRNRPILMSIFLSESLTAAPPLLVNPPPDLDLNLTIDDQGHTAVHWAAALARIKVLELLLKQGADVTARNNNGESALIRAAMVTNNFDNQTFPQLLNLLTDAIPLIDHKGRNIFHHIVMTSGIKGRTVAGRYYLESLITRIAKLVEEGKMSFKDLINVQDVNGDTPLNIASRLGNRNMAEMLMEVGADTLIRNKAGLKPADFGFGSNAPNLLPPAVAPVTTAVSTGKVVAYPAQDEPEFNFTEEATRGIDVLKTAFMELAEGHTKDIEGRDDAIKQAYDSLLKLTQDLTKERRLVDEKERFEWEAMCIQERQRRLRLTLDWAARDVRVTSTTEMHGIKPGENPTQALVEARHTLETIRKQNASLARDYTRSLAAVPANMVLCKEIIATICAVNYNEVDGLLDQLLKALDADGKTENLDLAQLNGFMARVKQSQGIMIGGNHDAPVAGV